ncbi:MAG: type II secretion system secretin GspD [Pigmentiphaga sp.]
MIPTSLLPRATPLASCQNRPAWRPTLLAAAVALCLVAPFHEVEAQSSQDSRVAQDEGVTLNFVEAELDAVVRALGHFTGKTFLIDPRVKGQLTLVSERPISRDIAYRMLLGALRMQGYAVVESDGIARVVPEADAKLQGSEVAATGSGMPQGDQLITRVFTLQFENAANLVPVLRPMISPNNPINAYPGNNTLVITDYAGNLNRIAEVIASVDTPRSTDTDVVRLRYAVAIDLADQLTRLLNTGSNDPAQRVVVIAEPRSNSLMLRSSSPARTKLALDLIRQLDTPEAATANMHVVTLRNAEAVRLAEVLRGVLTGQSQGSSSDSGMLSDSEGSDTGLSSGGSGLGSMGSSGGMGSGSALGSASNRQGSGGTGSLDGSGNNASTTFSGGGATVHADPTTNTLIITAPPPIYRNLRNVIDQLDVRRPQVFVESLIVEIISSDAAEFGIQWMAGLGNINRGGVNVIGGSTFGGTGTNLLQVAANPASLGSGLSLGVIDGTINLPGVGNILNLGFLARALESRGNANILSTPNLLTLNNEEASIMVGRNIPFPTGQYTQAGVGGINPFQTIERQDVGLQLRIRPQVSEGGTIKLAIHQEVSNIDHSFTGVSADLGVVTNKREVKTNVLVDDGQIIVLGGLLEDSVTGNRDQVPGLGDVPLLGNLFRYDTRSRTKTNLMIFLRPYVVRDADATRLTAQRYDLMRQMQPENMPPDHWLLPDLGLPTLPPRLAGAGDVLPASANHKAPKDAMVITQDPAAIYSSRGSNVILAATLASESMAQQAMQQITRGGFAPYVQVVRQQENPFYQVYIRVARDATSTDTAIDGLRQLGFVPELLVRP